MKLKRWLNTYSERKNCSKCNFKQKIAWYRFIKRYKRIVGVHITWNWTGHLWLLFSNTHWRLPFSKIFWLSRSVRYYEHLNGFHNE